MLSHSSDWIIADTGTSWWYPQCLQADNRLGSELHDQVADWLLQNVGTVTLCSHYGHCQRFTPCSNLLTIIGRVQLVWAIGSRSSSIYKGHYSKDLSTPGDGTAWELKLERTWAMIQKGKEDLSTQTHKGISWKLSVNSVKGCARNIRLRMRSCVLNNR